MQRGFDELRENVELAASSVLGDEASSLRFAQEELDSLTRELQAEQSDNEGNSPESQQREGQRPGSSQNPDEEGKRGQGLASTENQDGEKQGQSPANDGNQAGEQPGQEQTLADASSQQGQGQQPGQSDSQQSGQQSGGSQSGGSPSGEQRSGSSGGFGGGSEDIASALDDFLREFSSDPGQESPLTGRGFGDWNQRLRTVEELVEQPDIRQRLSQAREEAERLRAEFKRHGEMPQWGVVDEGIIAPLSEARSWLAQELARHEDPQALQPVDRDPVPRAYQESVRKYYEFLGQ